MRKEKRGEGRGGEIFLDKAEESRVEIARRQEEARTDKHFNIRSALKNILTPWQITSSALIHQYLAMQLNIISNNLFFSATLISTSLSTTPLPTPTSTLTSTSTSTLIYSVILTLTKTKAPTPTLTPTPKLSLPQISDRSR